METADQHSTANPPLCEDHEEQGLRILAKIIARKLAMSRRGGYTGAYEQDEDDSVTLGGAP